VARDLGLGTTAEESSGRAGAEQDQVTAAGGMVDAPDAAPWRLDQRAFLARRALRLLAVFLALATRVPEWHGLSVPTMESIWAALAPRNERLREAKPCAPCSHAGANDRPKTGAKKSRFFRTGVARRQ